MQKSISSGRSPLWLRIFGCLSDSPFVKDIRLLVLDKRFGVLLCMPRANQSAHELAAWAFPMEFEGSLSEEELPELVTRSWLSFLLLCSVLSSFLFLCLFPANNNNNNNTLTQVRKNCQPHK